MALDKDGDGVITEEEWTHKIFDDFRNPLQMLRETILENELSSDELLHKMKLRLDDEYLDYI